MKYDQLVRMRKRGLIEKAAAPCSVVGCTSCNCGIPNCKCGELTYVFDHCHIHDNMRGPVCNSCNVEMGKIDAVLTGHGCNKGFRLNAPVASYVTHYQCCSECMPVSRNVLNCKCVHVSGRTCHCSCLICEVK